MANGNRRTIGPVDLTPEILDTMTVIDPLQKGSTAKQQIRQAIGSALLGSSFSFRPSNGSSTSQPPANETQLGSGVLARPKSTMEQTLEAWLGNGEQGVTQAQGGSPEQLLQAALRNETGDEQTGISFADLDRQNIIGDQDFLSQFEGSRIEGLTPVGVPEPEEMSAFGKAFSSLAKALETPGVQRMLSQFGIAFSGGHPSSAGTILGRANIDRLDAQAEAELTSALMEGQTLEEALAGLQDVPSSDVIQRVSQTALRREQTQEDRGLKERSLDIQEQFNRDRIRIWEDRLGLQQGELDLKRLELIGKGNKTKGVDAWQQGMAEKTVASNFADIARAYFRLNNPEIADIQQINAAFESENIGLDPTKVRDRLPEELKKIYDQQVGQLSKSIARNFQDSGNLADFDIPTTNPIPQISTPQERDELDDGELFRNPQGLVFRKTANGQVRVQ